MQIRVANREFEGRKGLVGMLLSVFSDDDTRGNNGIEYISKSAAEFFGFDKDDLSTLECFTEEEVERFTTDNYMEQLLMELPEDMSEIEIVKVAYEMYASTMVNYCKRWQDYSVDAKNGYIKAVAYAFY